MNEQLVREALDEQAEREMPTSRDLWPSIHGRIQPGERSYNTGPQRSRRMPLLKPVFAVGVVALLLAFGAMSWLARPTSVSAAEIIARTEQAASSPGVKSFHGVWFSRLRNGATEPFFESGNESWYLAPSSRRSEGRSVGHDGQEETSLLVQDEKMMWLYLHGHFATNLVILKDVDSSISVFGGSDLQSLTNKGWLNDWYDPKLVGTDEVLGRKAYVLEFTLKPQDRWPPNSGLSQTAMRVVRMKYWVDQQAYFVLKIMAWDADGNMLEESGYTSFQIDAPIDPSIFSFAPPAGAQILDARIAEADELDALWKQTAQQAPFRVYRPTRWLSHTREGRPYFDAAQGVLTLAFPRADQDRHTGFEAHMPVITQKASPSAGVEGTGAAVKVGDTTGLYAVNESTQTLTIVRDGTEIVLSLPVVQGGNNMLSRMIEIAESLQPVQK